MQNIPSSLFKPSTTHMVIGTPGDEKYIEAIRLIRKVSYAGSNYQIFAPDVDPRAKENSFDVKLEGFEKFTPIKIDIEKVKNSKEILSKLKKDTTTVGILGAHFFDLNLRDVVQKLKKEGKYIIIAGVDKTFEANPFGPIGYLAIDADIITKMYHKCEEQHCENIGTRAMKLIDGKPAQWGTDVVHLGQTYKNVCLAHYKCEGSPEEKYLEKCRKERKLSKKIGRLSVFFGTMCSGKSELMINKVLGEAKKQNIDYQFIKPKIDTRTPNEIVSRTFKETGTYGIHFPAVEIDEANMWDFVEQEKDSPKKIFGIDEINLLQNATYFVNALRLCGHDVVVAGLAKEFRSELFGEFDYLICEAEEAEPLEAVCTSEHCKNKATEVQRLINEKPAAYDSPTIIIEGAGADAMKVTYHPRCLFHHEVPGKPEYLERKIRRKE